MNRRKGIIAFMAAAIGSMQNVLHAQQQPTTDTTDLVFADLTTTFLQVDLNTCKGFKVLYGDEIITIEPREIMEALRPPKPPQR